MDGYERTPGDASATSPPVPTTGDAGKVVTVNSTEDGYELDPPSGASGSPVVRKFPFTFDTPNLLTGAALYTPTVGDLLLDAWIEIDTAWDGTTPLGDVGPFSAVHTGFIGAFGPPVDMTLADDVSAFNEQMLAGESSNALSVVAQAIEASAALVTSAGANPVSLAALNLGGNTSRYLPAKFTTADPIKVVVSQDGTNTGAAPGSTVGAAVLYLVTCTPATA